MSYFTSDFDQVCGRLHGFIKACISDTLPFKTVVSFKKHQRYDLLYSMYNDLTNLNFNHVQNNLPQLLFLILL